MLSKGYKFVVVVTDYFTKWVESIPLKTMTSQNMIDFVVFWLRAP